jgi:hypothetical protein
MKKSYYVKAAWDPEAEVWVSESDIPGLVIEAETLGEFETLMMQLAPEMLSENENIHGASIPYHFTVDQQREFAVA